MAFVLKLTDEETELLRTQAEREHRSMHEVARLAVLERIAGAEQVERRDAFIRDELPNWAPVMQRLAES
jgi:predicted transcriptional regulator